MKAGAVAAALVACLIHTASSVPLNGPVRAGINQHGPEALNGDRAYPSYDVFYSPRPPSGFLQTVVKYVTKALKGLENGITPDKLDSSIRKEYIKSDGSNAVAFTKTDYIKTKLVMAPDVGTYENSLKNEENDNTDISTTTTLTVKVPVLVIENEEDAMKIEDSQIPEFKISLSEIIEDTIDTETKTKISSVSRRKLTPLEKSVENNNKPGLIKIKDSKATVNIIRKSNEEIHKPQITINKHDVIKTPQTYSGTKLPKLIVFNDDTYEVSDESDEYDESGEIVDVTAPPIYSVPMSKKIDNKIYRPPTLIRIHDESHADSSESCENEHESNDPEENGQTTNIGSALFNNNKLPILNFKENESSKILQNYNINNKLNRKKREAVISDTEHEGEDFDETIVISDTDFTTIDIQGDEDHNEKDETIIVKNDGSLIQEASSKRRIKVSKRGDDIIVDIWDSEEDDTFTEV